MATPLELYRCWRSVQDAHRRYQDAKTHLKVLARDSQGTVTWVDAEGCRWKISVGYGPAPAVTVQAIAHLGDVHGPAGD